MDNNAFGKKTPNSQRCRVDRFVAPRESFDELRRRQYVFGVSPYTPAFLYRNHVKQKNYVSHIDKAFGLETPPHPDQLDQSWPCVPRQRTYLSTADNILDLPTYSLAEFPDLLDWSNDNVLVAALGPKYYKWSWSTQSIIGGGFTLFSANCCRFDPSGERLALGTDMRRVEVHNTWNKMVAGGFCPCVRLQQEFCNITAIDWSPTGNSFVTGCSHGMITSFDRDANQISCRETTNGAILLVKVSPDARYLAVAEVDSAKVVVMRWPCLEHCADIGSDWIVKTIAWHPWRSALLGIGAVSRLELKSAIAVYDAPRQVIRVITAVSDIDFCLDTMLFSHLTGELVLSLWNTEREPLYPKQNSQLVVMSGSDSVVDQWGDGRYSVDRVRTMVFSPDGTKLATATADEDLIIWNFLPQDNKPSKKKRKRFSAMATYIDQTIDGFSLR